MTKTIKELNEARRQKALDVIYNFGNAGIMSLRRRIEGATITRKSAIIQKYSHKRVNLEYKKLKNPKTHYTLWYDDPKHGELGFDVPKLVYDAFVVGVQNG